MTGTVPLGGEQAAGVALRFPELFLRSPHADWDEARWATLSHELGLRYEVIDGVLYMSTAPSPEHQWITNRTVGALLTQIQYTHHGLTLWAPVGLFMPGTDPVQPEIMVLGMGDSALIRAKRIATIPLLLVEILSPSNADHDLLTKRDAYARAGVPEYWIMRPAEQDVLVHSDPELATGFYRQVRRCHPETDLISPTLPFRAPTRDLFAAP